MQSEYISASIFQKNLPQGGLYVERQTGRNLKIDRNSAYTKDPLQIEQKSNSVKPQYSLVSSGIIPISAFRHNEIEEPIRFSPNYKFYKPKGEIRTNGKDTIPIGDNLEVNPIDELIKSIADPSAVLSSYQMYVNLSDDQRARLKASLAGNIPALKQIAEFDRNLKGLAGSHAESQLGNQQVVDASTFNTVKEKEQTQNEQKQQATPVATTAEEDDPFAFMDANYGVF